MLYTQRSHWLYFEERCCTKHQSIFVVIKTTSEQCYATLPLFSDFPGTCGYQAFYSCVMYTVYSSPSPPPSPSIDVPFSSDDSLTTLMPPFRSQVDVSSDIDFVLCVRSLALVKYAGTFLNRIFS